MTTKHQFSWPVLAKLAPAAKQRREKQSGPQSAACAFRDRLQQSTSPKVRSDRSLFDGQLNVILPRPQLPPSHADEQACSWLSPEDTDDRTLLSSYDVFDEENLDLLNDLRHVLEGSGAFKEEPRLAQGTREWRGSAYGSLSPSGKLRSPTADVLHVTSTGTLCRKTYVVPRDDGKLFLCQRASCVICNEKSNAPYTAVTPPGMVNSSASLKRKHRAGVNHRPNPRRHI